MPEPLFSPCFPLQGIFCLFLQYHPAVPFSWEVLYPDLCREEERLLQRMHVQWEQFTPSHTQHSQESEMLL